MKYIKTYERKIGKINGPFEEFEVGDYVLVDAKHFLNKENDVIFKIIEIDKDAERGYKIESDDTIVNVDVSWLKRKLTGIELNIRKYNL